MSIYADLTIEQFSRLLSDEAHKRLSPYGVVQSLRGVTTLYYYLLHRALVSGEPMMFTETISDGWRFYSPSDILNEFDHVHGLGDVWRESMECVLRGEETPGYLVEEVQDAKLDAIDITYVWLKDNGVTVIQRSKDGILLQTNELPA